MQSKLSKLHDNVPPLEGSRVKEILERELGGPIDHFFSYLNLAKPLGSASIAQVHEGIWR